jgi:hypothetical protein
LSLMSSIISATIQANLKLSVPRYFIARCSWQLLERNFSRNFSSRETI